MKRSLLLFILVASSLFAAPSAKTIEEKIAAQNREVLKMAVSSIKPQLPQKVDDYTQIVDIEAEGEHLIYTFEIDTGPKSDRAVIEEAKKRMVPRIKNGICHSSKRFLQSGITISYRYRNASTHKKLFGVTVSQKECGSDFQ